MYLLLLAMLASTPVWAADDEVRDAVALLSRYPAGQVPVEAATMSAIELLGERGSRVDVGVLRSLAEHERSDVSARALAAIDKVRHRQREAQQLSFRAGLPTSRELEQASRPWRQVGMSVASSRVAAYASWVLGDEATGRPSVAGDARRYLATGRPRKALAALASESPSTEELRLLALAREDAGAPQQALQAYTLLALAGDAAAESVIAGYGVDSERLFLGLLVMERAGPVGDEEARLLEALVRSGGARSVDVLIERMFTAGGSERASAADTLIRMLGRSPLDKTLEDRIRAGLVRAVREGPAPVRDIAASGL